MTDNLELGIDKSNTQNSSSYASPYTAPYIVPESGLELQKDFMEHKYESKRGIITRDMILSKLDKPTEVLIQMIGNVLSLIEIMEKKAGITLTGAKKYYEDMLMLVVETSRAQDGFSAKLMKKQEYTTTSTQIYKEEKEPKKKRYF